MEKWVLRPGGKSNLRKAIHIFFRRMPVPIKCLRVMPVLAGAAAAGALSGTTSICRLGLCPFGCVLLFWLCRCRLDWHPAWLKIAIPAIYLFSTIRMAWIMIPAEQSAFQLAGCEFNLVGRICSAQFGSNESKKYIIRRPDGIRILLTGADASLQYGEVISLTVYGIKPTGLRNPGGFDEASWLASQGIFLIARPVQEGSLVILQSAPSFNPVEWGASARRRFQDFTGQILNPDQAALLTGLILGDTSGIKPAAKSNFRRSGLSHLTSVSGANVSFLLIPVTRILRRGRLGRKKRLWLLITALAGFGFLTGWQVSVSRAILMAGFVLIGQLLHRRADTLNSLAAAAWLMIMIWPLMVLSTGFWLSLAATASLLLFTDPCAERLRPYLPFLPDVILTGISASICVQTVLLPLIGYTSQEISIWSLLANLPAGILTAWILWVSIILLPAGALFMLLPLPCMTFLQNLPGRPIGFCLDLLDGLAEFFSRLLVGRLASRCLNPACWLAWAAMMINLMRCAPCFSGWANCILKTARKLCLPAMAAGGIVAVITGLSQPQISVWFLDVGQGDAILLQTSQGETLLVDGGETGSGYQVLMPAMDALGIHKIDLAVASHAHSDHVGGLIELIDAGRIDHILLPVGMIKQYNGEAESDPGRKLSKAIQISGIQMSELSEDDTIVLGSQIILDVLHAGPADTAVVEENLPDGNEWSLIMLAKLADHQLLLTSDCTQQTERQLLLKSTWPTAEFLKVAHHGSRLTTGEDFLNKVQPMAAIISVGLNVYGHPASETLSRLNQAGCQTYRTDQRGALQLILFPQKWELRAMLPKQGN